MFFNYSTKSIFPKIVDRDKNGVIIVYELLSVPVADKNYF